MSQTLFVVIVCSKVRLRLVGWSKLLVELRYPPCTNWSKCHPFLDKTSMDCCSSHISYSKHLLWSISTDKILPSQTSTKALRAKFADLLLSQYLCRVPPVFYKPSAVLAPVTLQGKQSARRRSSRSQNRMVDTVNFYELFWCWKLLPSSSGTWRWSKLWICWSMISLKWFVADGWWWIMGVVVQRVKLHSLTRSH